jgi:hypothetical protein
MTLTTDLARAVTIWASAERAVGSNADACCIALESPRNTVYPGSGGERSGFRLPGDGRQLSGDRKQLPVDVPIHRSMIRAIRIARLRDVVRVRGK